MFLDWFTKSVCAVNTLVLCLGMSIEPFISVLGLCSFDELLRKDVLFILNLLSLSGSLRSESYVISLMSLFVFIPLTDTDCLDDYLPNFCTL